LTNGTRHESLGLFCEWYEGKLVDKVILGGGMGWTGHPTLMMDQPLELLCG